MIGLHYSSVIKFYNRHDYKRFHVLSAPSLTSAKDVCSCTQKYYNDKSRDDIRVMSSLKLSTHYQCSRPCPRPVNTGVQNDAHAHGPCTRAVHAGSVYRALHSEPASAADRSTLTHCAAQTTSTLGASPVVCSWMSIRPRPSGLDLPGSVKVGSSNMQPSAVVSHLGLRLDGGELGWTVYEVSCG